MEQTYEDIVRKYYKKMKHNFIDFLMDKYRQSKMRQEDAEDIYQSIFIAIQENLMLGRIKENTSWSSYIMTLGLNMASKQYRRIGKTDSTDDSDENNEEKRSKIARKVDELIKSMSDEEPELYKDPAAQEVLGDELTHTPDPCATIIRLTYYSGLSDAEITEEFDRYNSSNAVKAKRWQCMKDLIYRVKLALYNAGIIDVKPEKK